MNSFSEQFTYLMNPVTIFMFKVNNRNTRERCDLCSKLTIKTSELRQWRPTVSTVDFEQVNIGWE